MERVHDAALNSFWVAVVVSLILMCFYPLNFLIEVHMMFFVYVLLLLILSLWILILLCLCPAFYLIDLLFRIKKRRLFSSMLAHAFTGLMISTMIYSLCVGKLEWNYFYCVPGILSGFLFPVMERWN